MAKCLDANTFIEAKNRYYGLDFCPAFWNWLDAQREAGEILCVRAIYDEIEGGGDDLAAWMRDRRAHSWLMAVDTEEVQQAYRQVVGHVEGRRGNPYTDAAIADFMAGADPWLIAFCIAGGHTVVTHELPEPLSRRKVKIPDVCNALHVPWMNTFEALRQLNARFVLQNP